MLWQRLILLLVTLAGTAGGAKTAELKSDEIVTDVCPSFLFSPLMSVGGGGVEVDDQPKILIRKDSNTGQIFVDVEASETKPTDIFIDLDGKGFLFLAGFYAPSRFTVFPSIRHAPCVLIKAEKRRVIPGELPLGVFPNRR